MKIKNEGIMSRRERKKQREKRKENVKAIIDISAEAKKCGMSYGQYVAMKYLEQLKMERVEKEHTC